MLPLQTPALLEHLKRNGVHAEIEQETNQITIMLKISEREFPLFIRIFDGGELIQFLVFLPCHTQEKTVPDTARLLHLLNKQIDFPGFCTDEMTHTIFYRCMMPIRNNKIDSAIFDAILNAVQVVCGSFVPVIVTVASGLVSFEDIKQQILKQR